MYKESKIRFLFFIKKLKIPIQGLIPNRTFDIQILRGMSPV
jgi:hypothetical protein